MARASQRSSRPPPPPRGPGGRPFGAVGIEGAVDEAVADLVGGKRLVQACGSDLGEDGATQIAAALAKSRDVLSLNLRGGQVGTDGASMIAEVLGRRHGPLRRLDFCNNDIGDRGAMCLVGEMSKHGALQQLLLKGNGLEDKAAASIASVLGSHPKLDELDLSNNKIGPEGTRALAAALRHPALQILNLDLNPIGDEGAVAIAEALGKDPLPPPEPPEPAPRAPGGAMLRRPEQSRGAAGKGGPRGAAGRCAESPGLRVLHVSDCQITDKGGQAFADLLDLRREGLRELHLGFNTLTDASGVRLAEALEGHSTLRVLWLEGNQLHDPSSTRFVAGLARMGRDDVNVNMGGNIVKRLGKSQRFDEVTLGDLARFARTVKDLANRGVTLHRLLKFYFDYSEGGKIEPSLTTTAQAVASIVAPETRAYWNSFATFFNKPTPDYYVIHSWDGLFFELVMAVARHATGVLNPSLDPGDKMYEKNPQLLQTCYFIDALAVNQNLKHAPMESRFESDKFEMVMNLVHMRGGECVLALDAKFLPLTRLQCLVEVHQCLCEQMPLTVTFGKYCPFPRFKGGWGNIETSTLSGSKHEKKEEVILKSLLGVNKKNKSTEAQSARVKTALMVLIAEQFQADRKVLPSDQQYELDMAELELFEVESAAAIRIQKWMRGIWGRRKAAARRHDLRMGFATVIQTWWREIFPKLKQKLATTIQRWWRDEPRGLQRSRAEQARRAEEAAAQRARMMQLFEVALHSGTIHNIQQIAMACAAGTKRGTEAEEEFRARLRAEEEARELAEAEARALAKAEAAAAEEGIAAEDTAPDETATAEDANS